MAESTHQAARRQGATGVHSLNRFVFTVPDLEEARRFYSAFGLDGRAEQDRLDLYTHGHAHRWASAYANGKAKKLQFLSFGIFAEDVETFRARVRESGAACEPHPLSDGSGLWLRNPDGIAVQLAVAPKVTLTAKATPSPLPRFPRVRARRPRAAPLRRCGRGGSRIS